MHPTAMSNCQMFFDTYSNAFLKKDHVKVIDIGAQDINGSLRSIAHPSFEYIGVDFVDGKGVDVVLTDPYHLPFESESADIILSSSCFEHSEMFWIVFLEILRVLKPHGLFYLNTPANGYFHRYPVDCWRFYPDSGRALIKWAKRNSINSALLESYTSDQRDDIWNDFVAIFLKDESFINNYPKRILDTITDFRNGLTYGSTDFLKYTAPPEDQLKLNVINQIITNKIKIN